MCVQTLILPRSLEMEGNAACRTMSSRTCPTSSRARRQRARRCRTRRTRVGSIRPRPRQKPRPTHARRWLSPPRSRRRRPGQCWHVAERCARGEGSVRWRRARFTCLARACLCSPAHSCVKCEVLTHFVRLRPPLPVLSRTEPPANTSL